MVNSYIFNTFKYHVFALMGRFQLESIYLYFPAGTTVDNKGKLIHTYLPSSLGPVLSALVFSVGY
jgi:hypothetical protein